MAKTIVCNSRTLLTNFDLNVKDKVQKDANEKLKNTDYESEVLPDGSTRYFKDVEVTESKVIPGKAVTKKAESSGSWLDSFKNEKDNALYEQYKGTEGGPTGEPGTKEYAKWKSTFAGFGESRSRTC